MGTLENVVPSSEKQTSRYELSAENSEERNKHNKEKIEAMTYIWVCSVKYVIDFYRMEGKNCGPHSQRREAVADLS